MMMKDGGDGVNALLFSACFLLAACMFIWKELIDMLEETMKEMVSKNTWAVGYWYSVGLQICRLLVDQCCEADAGDFNTLKCVLHEKYFAFAWLWILDTWPQTLNWLSSKNEVWKHILQPPLSHNCFQLPVYGISLGHRFLLAGLRCLDLIRVQNWWCSFWI